jgi:glycosyltransferase involved in cell wall biosynthesis
VGQLDQEALSRIIPHCIMLSPSAGQLALLECALGGAPIVAYDRDFQPEFIDDGVDGFIVPYRDHAAMAERAAKILADRNLARGLSEAVRIKAEFHVDPNRVREAEWDAFGKALGTRMPD